MNFAIQMFVLCCEKLQRCTLAYFLSKVCRFVKKALDQAREYMSSQSKYSKF